MFLPKPLAGKKSPRSRPVRRLPGFFSRFVLLYNHQMTTAPTRRVSSGERINPADPSGHLQQALRQRGIRLTRQRRVILQVMDSAEQHLDVDQILQARSKSILRWIW